MLRLATSLRLRVVLAHRNAIEIATTSSSSSSRLIKFNLLGTRCIATTPSLQKKGRVRLTRADKVTVKEVATSKVAIDCFDTDMTCLELATALKVPVDEVLEAAVKLESRFLDDLQDENKVLDRALLLRLVASFGGRPRWVSRPRKTTADNDADWEPKPQPPAPDERCVRRPPVVTIMGHVDHGKTTLLDSLRKSRLAAAEHGGITQHIGAFEVSLGVGRTVTFLDTPGHAAFAAMRERGARATDLVVLVVAADDGCQPQTVQSIGYAREAGVPLVVAINKCDRPNADPERAKRSLLQHDVVAEEMGGNTQCIEISALYGKGIDTLTEAILTQAEVMDLRAPHDGLVEGVVIESSVAVGVGKLSTVIVQRGTLRANAILVAGSSWTRIRTMTDENGKVVAEATPSRAVRVSGWKDQPPAPGVRFFEVADLKLAEKAVATRLRREMQRKAEQDWEATAADRERSRSQYEDARRKMLEAGRRYGSTLRNVLHKQHKFMAHDPTAADVTPQLNLILRSDVEGTLEAIVGVLDTYADPDVVLRLVDCDVGPPTMNDVQLAQEANALILLFNVNAGANVRSEAEKVGIHVETYHVIYRLIERIKSELTSRLPVVKELELVGEGRVLKEFMISDRGRKPHPIAGCLVEWGEFARGSTFRFLRGAETIYEGPVESMKRETETVTTSGTNTEVGIALHNKDVRFKPDDVVQVLVERSLTKTIAWDPVGFSDTVSSTTTTTTTSSSSH